MFLPSKLRYALYGLVFGLAVSVYPFGAFVPKQCEDTKINLADKMSMGFAAFSSATASAGFNLITMTDRQGNWLIIGIDEDETACVLVAGDDFMIFGNEGI